MIRDDIDYNDWCLLMVGSQILLVPSDVLTTDRI